MSSDIFDSLPHDKQELIEAHLSYVIEANKVVNLTRIDNREEARVLHIEDSLTALQELNDAPPGLYGDMGTGAGYPGIPLGIVSGRKTVLIDARKKKVEVLEDILNKMGCADSFRLFNGRVELLARKEAGRYSVLTARALSQLSVLMELASPLLKKGGCLICYKSQLSEEELSNAMGVQDIVGMKKKSDRSFTLSDGETQRRILCFEKVAAPKIKLPRQEGKAQKSPL